VIWFLAISIFSVTDPLQYRQSSSL